MSDAPPPVPASRPAPVRFTLGPPTDAGADAKTDAGAPDAGGDAPRTVVLRAEGEHVVIEAASRLTLRVGASALTLDADGTIVLHGVRVTAAGDETLDLVSGGPAALRGAPVRIN